MISIFNRLIELCSYNNSNLNLVEIIESHKFTARNNLYSENWRAGEFNECCNCGLFIEDLRKGVLSKLNDNVFVNSEFLLTCNERIIKKLLE